MSDIFQVIKTIRLSEKATLLTDKNNEYVLEVDRRSNKLQIREAVERILRKKVASVNTCNYRGKKKRLRRTNYGRTAHWKKAIVKLKEGESIDLT